MSDRIHILDPDRFKDLPLRFIPTSGQHRCLTVLCRWKEPHNMRHWITQRGIEPSGQFGIKLAIRGELATYDGNHLTSLVAACHQWRVRLAVSGRANGILEITLHARQPRGHTFERHPGPDQLGELADLYRIEGLGR